MTTRSSARPYTGASERSGPDGSRPPAQVPGFSRFQRYWDRENERWTVKILPGEYYVTRGDEAISTVLGSCVSACVRDPALGVGGMNHFLLPEKVGGAGRGSPAEATAELATRYGSHAMDSLITDLAKLGAVRERLEVKLFGGGRILSSMNDIGKRNIEFVSSYLSARGLRVAASDLGGTQPRKLVYFPASGRARLRKLRPVENRIISHHEQLYLANLSRQLAHGDIDLLESARTP